MEPYAPPMPINEAMRGGLARLYADVGIRSYLENAIRIANHNTLASLKADKPDLAKEFAIRLDTLEKLLEKGRAMFEKGASKSAEPLLVLDTNNATSEKQVEEGVR